MTLERGDTFKLTRILFEENNGTSPLMSGSSSTHSVPVANASTSSQLPSSGARPPPANSSPALNSDAPKIPSLPDALVVFYARPYIDGLTVDWNMIDTEVLLCNTLGTSPSQDFACVALNRSISDAQAATIWTPWNSHMKLPDPHHDHHHPHSLNFLPLVVTCIHSTAYPKLESLAPDAIFLRNLVFSYTTVSIIEAYTYS
jgi:hypothetical protein